jgi:DNA polymerase-3 subunit alpha
MPTRCSAFSPDRLYIELCRRGDETEIAAEAALIELAFRARPAAGRHQSRLLHRSPRSTALMMSCCASPLGLTSTPRSAAFLARGLDQARPSRWPKLFADLPEALANTAVVAQRCAVAAPKRKPILADLTADEAAAIASGLARGLEKRLAKLPGEFDRQVYFDRLDFEVEVIAGMGFAATSSSSPTSSSGPRGRASPSDPVVDRARVRSWPGR